jgi:hypothetical protein
MNNSVKSDLKNNFSNIFFICLLYAGSIFLLCHVQTSNQIIRLPKSADQGTLDSVEIESSMRSRDILYFITGVDSLPEYLKVDLHVRIICSILSSLNSKFSKVSRTVTVEDSIKYNELYNRLMEMSCWKKDLLEYKESSDYVEDIIDHIYLAYTPFNYKIKGDKVRSIKKMLIEYKTFSRKEIKKLSRAELKLKIVKAFEIYQFGEYKPPINSKLVYERVSVMNQIYGNPSIDFSYEFDSTMSYGKRAFYSSSDHTMYLGVYGNKPLYYYLDDWISELAHSAQYCKLYAKEVMNQRNLNEFMYIDSVRCLSQNSLVAASDIKDSKAESKSVTDVKEEMYKKKEKIHGFYTKEYEAHQIIEPELVREYEKRRKNILK